MNRRILIVAGIVLVAGYVAFGLSRIRFDVDITRLMPTDLKEAEGARLFLDHYSRQGELVVTLEGEDGDEVGEAAESLAEAFRGEEDQVQLVVSQPAWETEEGGEEMLEFAAWALINRPVEELEELERSLAPGAVEQKLEDSLKRLTSSFDAEEMATLEYDPLGFLRSGLSETFGQVGASSEFGSEDGTFRVLYVVAKKSDGSYRDKIEWIEAMWAVVGAWERGRESGAGNVAVGFTGEPAFVAEISGGMEGDMRNSGAFTLVMISLIFWFAYRRLRPLLDLVLALVLIFVLTLATGGILFRELSAISIGFASILIGLTVDYGVILYQEARETGGSVSKIRKSAGRGIVWASLTTAAAFISLAAGRVPGLAELGVLVGSGVLIGAVVMFGGFVYRAVAAGKKEATDRGVGEGEAVGKARRSEPASGGMVSRVAAWVTAVGLLCSLGFLVISGAPEMDSSSAALRPRNSSADTTMGRLAEKLGDSEGLVSVIVAADDLPEAGDLLAAAASMAQNLQEKGIVKSYVLPTSVWPRPDIQRENLSGACARLVAARERLREASDAAGFEESGFVFAEALLDAWEEWGKDGEFPVWPETYAARRAVSRFVDWEPGGNEGSGVWALGLIRPAEAGNRDDLHKIRGGMDLEGVYLSGGNTLSMALAEVVPSSVIRIFVVLCGLVLVALVLAFRRLREVVLTVASVGLTMGAMLGAMTALGISWNFMNLAALLLALGAGLDYAIHILIDLQRHRGDVQAVQRGVGRALLVCGLSSVAGFGSLAWATNLGLSSLGQACALALAINTAVAVFLLPRVWAWWPSDRDSAT